MPVLVVLTATMVVGILHNIKMTIPLLSVRELNALYFGVLLPLVFTNCSACMHLTAYIASVHES